MAINLLILTSYFATKPEDIQGGVGYRYAGLYGSLIKKLLETRPESKVFWYSHSDTFVRSIDKKGIISKEMSMFQAVTYVLDKSSKEKSKLVVIVAFPHGCPKTTKLLDYFFSLITLKLAHLSVKIFVDYFDPPIQARSAFNARPPSIFAKAYFQLLEMLTLKLANKIIVLNKFWIEDLVKRYRLSSQKFLTIPNGALINLIGYHPPVFQRPVKILYAGIAAKSRGIDNLINVVSKLNKEGLKTSLYIGCGTMSLPNWVNAFQLNWPEFVQKVLLPSDICVLPYPPGKVFFDRIPSVKLFDYMAAGKPVISTDLPEVKELFTSFSCGLVAKDWNQFRQYIEKLSHDKELAKTLGMNGRKAVLTYFDYDKLAKKLLHNILKE